MKKRRAGMSMMEVSLAVFLLFLTSAFVMSMFYVGSSLPVHAQKNDLRDNLAQVVMDREMAVPLAQVTPLPRTPVPSNTDYLYQVDTASVSVQGHAVTRVTVTVTAPNGTHATLVGLRPPNVVAPTSPAWTPTNPTASGQPPPPVPPLNVIGQYGCVGCHTIDGVNSSGLFAPTLTPDFLTAQAAINGMTVYQLVESKLSNPLSVRDAWWYVGKPPNQVVPMYAYTDVMNMPANERDQVAQYMSDMVQYGQLYPNYYPPPNPMAPGENPP
jgi:mono/diheme cytochrome c family protein